ncbi:MAG TPA: 7TM diverse intracellular signaling domain-containing protein, partial [Alphaproteobacteria bacterium]|nr:7TM diverse intracellular signaling domain-containing protein [Alphaproteobacteria bacterium]
MPLRLLFVLCCLLTVVLGPPPARAGVPVRHGIADLSDWDPAARPVVRLDGEWAFDWQRFVPPGTGLAGAERFVPVPSDWETASHGAGDLTRYGFATYRLMLRLGPQARQRRLALELRGVRSAYRLWLNGEAQGGMGEPAAVAADEQAVVRPATYRLPRGTATVEVLIQVSNHLSKHNGLKVSPSIGLESALRESMIGRLATEAIVAGAIFFLGAYNLLFYSRRRPDQYAFFGITAMLVGLRSATISPIWSFMFPWMSQECVWRLEYLTSFAVLPAVYAMFQTLFPQEIERRARLALLVVGVLGSIGALVGPFSVMATIVSYYQYLVLAVFAYLLVCILLAALRRRHGSVLALLGVAIVTVGAVHDFLYYRDILSTGEILAAATLAGLICFAGIHARHFRRTVDELEAFALAQQQANARLAQQADELHRTTDALRRSEEDFRQLAESSIQGILIASEARKPLFANERVAQIFGYADVNEVLALDSTAVLIAPYELQRLNEIREAYLQAPQPSILYEFDGQRKDGSIIRLEVLAGAVHWHGSRAAYLALIDITERARAEHRLEQFFSLANDMFCILDPQGRV